MDTFESERLDKVKKYFTLLKEGFLYMEAHPNETEANQAMIERARKNVFPKLTALGVHETFSAMILVNGPNINWGIVRQFAK